MKTAWIAIVAAASIGCATKGHVAREVGEVNQKVDDLSTEVERTQDRVRQNEGRLDGLDTSVADAKGSAAAAMTRAEEADARAAAAEKLARGKLIFTVTLSNDKVRFPFNRAELSEEARALVDEAVIPLKEADRGVFFEIEGHTDSSGEEAYNQQLGLERAEAVRDYLYTAHGIPLARMEVISFGESKPVVDNTTPENRSQNRRVVIKILE